MPETAVSGLEKVRMENVFRTAERLLEKVGEFWPDYPEALEDYLEAHIAAIDRLGEDTEENPGPPDPPLAWEPKVGDRVVYNDGAAMKPFEATIAAPHDFARECIRLDLDTGGYGYYPLRHVTPLPLEEPEKPVGYDELTRADHHWGRVKTMVRKCADKGYPLLPEYVEQNLVGPADRWRRIAQGKDSTLAARDIERLRELRDLRAVLQQAHTDYNLEARQLREELTALLRERDEKSAEVERLKAELEAETTLPICSADGCTAETTATLEGRPLCSTHGGHDNEIEYLWRRNDQLLEELRLLRAQPPSEAACGECERLKVRLKNREEAHRHTRAILSQERERFRAQPPSGDGEAERLRKLLSDYATAYLVTRDAMEATNRAKEALEAASAADVQAFERLEPLYDTVMGFASGVAPETEQAAEMAERR